MARLSITVSPLGHVAIEGKEFVGADCTEASRAYEAAMGGAGGVTSREFKPEYHDTKETAHEVERW